MGRTTGVSELLLAIDRSRRETLRGQIVSQLRDAIASGQLRAGEPLPATRVLAAGAGVSRGVVVEAYTELRGLGAITTGRGRSPRVSGQRMRPGPPGPPDRAPRFDLVLETPDVTLFPRRQWLRALTEAVSRAPDRAFDYADPLGVWELRSALAAYLGRTRGVITEPANVVICQGSIQAVDLTLRVAAARGGRAVALEDPCAGGLRTAARFAGLSRAPVAVDQSGIDVATLAASAADAVIVTPSHQFPSGVRLTPERRGRLLDWAGSRRLIIEDDYDCEFHFDQPPAPALQSEASDSIAYVGSASKTLAPGIRIGWAVLPSRFLAQARAIKTALDGGSPSLTQYALAHMLLSGAFDRHLRSLRGEYARRRATLMAALPDAIPNLTVRPGTAGLHVCAELGAPVDGRRFERACGQERLRVRTLERFLDVPPKHVATLLVGFGRTPQAAIAPAAAALRRAVDRAAS
jgi:GntR family transcriptional regulator / MocR family aminotransferase